MNERVAFVVRFLCLLIPSFFLTVLRFFSYFLTFVLTLLTSTSNKFFECHLLIFHTSVSPLAAVPLPPLARRRHRVRLRRRALGTVRTGQRCVREEGRGDLPTRYATHALPTPPLSS